MSEYFKTANPNGKIWVGTRALKFDLIEPGLGVLEISDDPTLKAVYNLMARGQGGLERIEEAEYLVLVQKKRKGKIWREEMSFGNGVLRQTFGENLAPPAVKAKPTPVTNAPAFLGRPTATRRT